VIAEGQVAARLEAERSRLVAQLAALRRTHGEIVEASELVATDDEHDPEGATIAFERAQVAALVRDGGVVLTEIDDALARLAVGTYGTCVRCGRPIAPARLEARPATPTCVDCAV
jgi:RNA polymerase-binding transcription factor DksA